MSQPTRAISIEQALTAAVAFLIGLLPVFHLTALQLITLLILIVTFMGGKAIWTQRPARVWPFLLLAQFALFFLINAYVFPSLEGNMRHYRRVALESWSVTFVAVGLLWLFAGRHSAAPRGFLPILQRWMPLGLIVSFLIMTAFFSTADLGRPEAFATTANLPPLWFLSLTLMSFCGFHDMSRKDQALRGILIVLAAGMAFYSGGRAILAIWFLSTVILGIYLMLSRPGERRPLRDFTAMLGALLAIALGLYAIDAVTGGTLDMRIRYTLTHLGSEGLSDKAFFRLELWSAALEIISDHAPWGAGQVNERYLIHQIVEREWWFRAHQTYLSYLIAGGWLALLSGLVFQAAALCFATRALFPAVLGLVLVPGLSGLTDSLFQSLFSVQVYCLLVAIMVTALPQRAEMTSAQ